MKNCSRKTCEQKNPQPLTQFYKKKSTKDGLQYECISCTKKGLKDWAKNNKEYTTAWRKNWEFKKKYGITTEERDKIFNLQEGKCAICAVDEKDLTVALHIDHCHKTKKIRGLLCGAHNQALGLFNDDVELLQKAIDYLKSKGS